MIQIISSSRYKINRRSIKQAAEQTLSQNPQAAHVDLNIVFVGKNKMKSIAKKYKKEDVALPVLSFPYNERQEGNTLIGEVLICFPQAVLMAAERNKKVDQIIVTLVEHGIQNLLK